MNVKGRSISDRRCWICARRLTFTTSFTLGLGPVYARVLPGYDPQLKSVPGAVYFVVGPEKQFAAYEAYLKFSLGPDTRIHRLYPRDFWMTMND